MKRFRFALPVLTILVAIFALLYTGHATRASDHQDTIPLFNKPGADITDQYVFPSPSNSNNVVFVMNVSPLIPQGQGITKFFDPTVMYQFKISHGPVLGNTAAEDTVIQFAVNGTGASQTLTVFGPAAPAQTGSQNTFISNPVGIVGYNAPATLSNGIQVFAGPRSDPFFIDLGQFFKIVPDRDVTKQIAGSVPPASASSFNGFAPGIPDPLAPGKFCLTTPSSDLLGSNNFNVLSIIVEVPKSFLQGTGANGNIIHSWATTSTTSGS